MRGTPPDRSDRLFDEVEGFRQEQRVRWQLDRLGDVLRTASAPSARSAAQAAGLLWGPAGLEALRRLPVLRKDTLPQLQAASPPLAGWASWDRVRKLYASPGPIYEPEGPGPDYWGFAPALHAAGVRAGDVVLNCYAHHLTPAGSMMEGGLLSLGAIVVPGGVGNTEIQVRAAAHLGATGYVGTPSFLGTLLDKAVEAGVDLGLEVALVSGERMPESVRRRFSDAGIRTQQAYATADVGLIAYECPLRSGMHTAARCIVELLDPASGDPVSEDAPGEVVVTLLDSTYPLLRLATGDLAQWTAEPCPCGRTAPRLRGILGRVGEAVKVRGMFVHPAELRAAMEEHPRVIRYQFVVVRAGGQDELIARLEAAPDPALEEAVRRSVRAHARLRCRVDFVPAGTIAADAAMLTDARTWEDGAL
ncbi:MAG: phenylacetate--CoA ligase family protein [Armatimonadota bacterium]|nr:phenylacetate--CoA ligase family protein [Armatimonadota bacterium]MDR5697539.1 phenylacetate--CoA ligase family protein [Armatimonadota bacterium]